jgi:hypothetical protein
MATWSLMEPSNPRQAYLPNIADSEVLNEVSQTKSSVITDVVTDGAIADAVGKHTYQIISHH